MITHLLFNICDDREVAKAIVTNSRIIEVIEALLRVEKFITKDLME
jgi:hypothetical protein